eukprot:14961-Heterococcus_DN1.PRE.1
MFRAGNAKQSLQQNGTRMMLISLCDMKRLLVKMRSFAMAGPTSLGNSTVPPAPGNTPEHCAQCTTKRQ